MINQSADQSTFEITKNPYSFYEEIRSIHPVYKWSFLKYPGWYVTGYQEALTILKDNRFQTRIPLPETTKKYEALKKIHFYKTASCKILSYLEDFVERSAQYESRVTD
jgi:cytochrome P450